MTTVGSIEQLGAVAPELTSTTRGDPGFARALAAATRSSGPATDPTARPSVGIEVMLHAYASGDHERVNSPVMGSGGPPSGGSPGDPRGVVDASRALSGQQAGTLDTAVHPVLTAGERYLGTPYVWGGTDASVGFDCSGFVQQAYADLGVSLPRVSADQARAGVAVDGLERARPGDLVYWNGDGSRPNHIGIYAGNGEMLVAPSTGDVVRYQQITREPHAVRRVLT